MHSATEIPQQDVRTRTSNLASQFCRFGIIGALAAVVHLAGFWLCLRVGFPYPAAFLLSWLPSVTLSYWLNREHTFGVEGQRDIREAAAFLATAVGHLAASFATLALMVEILHVQPFAASLINLLVMAILNFAVLRQWVFRVEQTAAPESARQ